MSEQSKSNENEDNSNSSYQYEDNQISSENPDNSDGQESKGNMVQTKDKNLNKKKINNKKETNKEKENQSQQQYNSENQDDLDEAEEESKTCRLRIEQFMSVGEREFIFQIVISVSSMLSFIGYIICTYVHKLFKYFNFFDLLIVFIYFIEYFMDLLLAHHKLSYIISFTGLINLLVMVPSLFCFLTDDYMHSYLYMMINISRVIRFTKIFGILFNMKKVENNVTFKLITIISILVQIIFISAGLAQIVEYTEVENRIKITTDRITKDSLNMRQNFHHYIYLLVVTTLTVGYGDIIPFTVLAKGMFIIIILLVIGIIPYQINDLIQIMGAQNEYQLSTYKCSGDIPHIILTGDISLDSLKSFCLELFHPDHGSGYRHAVILSNTCPSREMEIFLANEQFIFYLQGDPLNEKDLLRADTHKAKACIIFNNKNSKDPYSMDHQSLFLGIFIKKFVYNYNLKESIDSNEKVIQENQSFHLCMQLNKPESNAHFFNTLQSMYKKGFQRQDQLIIIESLKMNLLSKSCLTPGIMALITNLVMSSGETTIDKNDMEWLKEYSEGRGHEIYRIKLHSFFKSKSFLEIVEYVYNMAQAIVFALEIEVGSASVLKLNPSSNLKLNEIIGKLKDQTVTDRYKDNQGGNQNTKNNTAFEEIDSRERNNFKDNNGIDKKCEVFAYLICSDKQVADNIAAKDKEFVSNSSEVENLASKQNQSTLNQNKSNNNDFIENIAKPIIERNNELEKDESESKSSDSDDITDNDEIMQFCSSDLVFYKKDYYFNNTSEYNMRNNTEIMHHSIKDREDITNHIVICGLHPSLVHFILPLRAKYLKEDTLKYVVILAPSLPQTLFEAFTKFKRIIFIQGSPLLPENLLRANILNADKAVILSSGESKVIKPTNHKGQSITYSSEEQMLDAETIFIYKAIKKCNKHIQIMTELICTSNIEYLLDTSNLQKLFNNKSKESNLQYEFTPLYASGEVFTPSIIDRITCQSFYNPHIVTIIELILGGENAMMSRKSRELEEIFNLGGSNLYLVKIPEAYVNEPFKEFFYFLIKVHHCIVIALYRKNIIEGYYYVYTNPKKTTLLRDCDYVFVLANTTNILDLIEERGLVDNLSSDSSLNEDEKQDDNKSINNNKSKVNDKNDKSNMNSTMQNNDSPSTKKKKKFSRSETPERSETRRITAMDRMKLEERKALGNPKHNEIERLKGRLKKITSNLEELQTEINSLSGFVDSIVEEEVLNEFKVISK